MGNFEIVTESAIEKEFETLLYEDCDKQDANAINSNLTYCSVDILLFAFNFS